MKSSLESGEAVVNGWGGRVVGFGESMFFGLLSSLIVVVASWVVVVSPPQIDDPFFCSSFIGADILLSMTCHQQSKCEHDAVVVVMGVLQSVRVEGGGW